MVEKLKLGALVDDKPVKVTIDLPAALYADLVAYTAVHAKVTGQAAVAPEKLIAPMLARFMSTDRGFARAKRHVQVGGSE
jgi:hypothetical protein